MGRAPRPTPSRLAEKLLHIRTKMKLSQNGMIRHMGLEDVLRREEISDFERSKRTPPLPVLLAFAKAAGVPVEVLIDDGLTMPSQVPTGLHPDWAKNWEQLLLLKR